MDPQEKLLLRFEKTDWKWYGQIGRTRRQKTIIGVGYLCTVVFLCNFAVFYFTERRVEKEPQVSTNPSISLCNKTFPFSTNETEETCIHPEIDFFDPEIMKFYKNPPKLECNQYSQIYSSLIRGKLVAKWPELHDCWGRNSTASNAGKWYHTEENFIFLCDVVETRCSDKGKFISEAFDFYIHTQIVELPHETPKFQVSGKQYDVYFFIVDSTAHTQMFRNFNKTNNFLLNDLEAIAFPYLNRIGHNSRPNGFAWFFGKLSDTINRDIYNLPPLKPEPGWERNKSCSRKLDNETMLLKEFRDYGYMTNHVAEYVRTVDYGCEGADVPFTHHTYTPYFHTTETETKIKLEQDHCLLPHQHAIKYFDQFANSYSGKPKMGFMWLTKVGHTTAYGSMDADPHFFDFFTKNKHILEDSFVIFGGDHGLRTSDAVATKVGALDFNNPALLITVPKELRKNKELMEILKENSKELQTHFDTRATLLDILKYQPSANFKNNSMMTIEGEFGHSFLRQQPKPRTCRALPIPIEYCICENYPRQDVLKRSLFKAKSIGFEIIDRINLFLHESEIAHKCRKWSFVKTEKLFQFSSSVGSVVHYIGTIQATTDIGRGAEFYVFMSRKKYGSLGILALDRLDMYWNNGHCVSKDFEAVCHCF